MASPCNDIRARLWAQVPLGDGSHDVSSVHEPAADLAAHLAGCAECAQLWRRARALGAALGGLERRPAPAELAPAVEHALSDAGREDRALAALGELSRAAAPSVLDGGVVCALNAGHRQDRAAAALVGLTRREAPQELEERLVEPLPRSAPDVLDRLVAEELADPAKSMSRRFAGRLARLRAPATLERRVEAELRGMGPRPSSRDASAASRPSLRLGPFAAAAGLAALLFAGRALWTPAEREAPPKLSFEVQRASSLGELNPAARGWVGGIAGGLLEAGGGR